MNIKKLHASIIVFIVFLALPITAYAQDTSYKLFKGNAQKEKPVFNISSNLTDDKLNIYDRQLIIKLKENHTFDAGAFSVQLVEGNAYLENENILIVKVPDVFDLDKKQAQIENHPDVIYAEADIITNTAGIPLQEVADNQWYLNQIEMPDAWKLNEGSKDITIAVLDTGVNKDHPALKNRIKPGKDIIHDKKGAKDDHGHGTHVAGIIAAHSNEMIGLDLNASILPVKVMDEEGHGSTSDIVNGIYYAIEQDVDIINMSYVNYTYSAIEEEALWKAYEKGIVLVAASGNHGWARHGYPASYVPVISVGATNEYDDRAVFSNYGDWIDIAAPGVNIFSLNYLGGYRFDSGTSFSAPMVSALAGMIKAQFPDWQPEEVEWALESTTKKLSHLEWDPNFGYGSVNAYQAFSVTPEITVEEAHNRPSKAVELQLNDTIKGNLALPMDVGWYQFKLLNPAHLSIKINDLPDHLDLIGTLYKKDNGKLRELVTVDQGSRGESEKMLKNLQPGTYYFSVHDYFGKWSKDDFQLETHSIPIEKVPRGFSDVSSYKEQINFLAAKNVIQGYEDGSFKPRNKVSRLQALQMILNEMEVDVEKKEVKDPGFKDINKSSYGYRYIATAVELGIIKGKDDNTFDPYGHLTRAQLAAMMVNAYDLEGSSDISFKDVPPEHWAYDVVTTLAANEITKGYEDHTFRPNTQVSREHFAVFLYNKMVP